LLKTLSRRPLLSLVTDRRRLGVSVSEEVTALLDLVASAVAGGVDLVQVRERDLSDLALLEIVTRCVELARAGRTAVVVNDRVDIALAAGADGVHLRANSVPVAAVRTHVPPGFLLGRSVHDATEAFLAADAGGLDYVMLGTVFVSRSKPGVTPTGVGALQAAARAVTLPVLAIGGVTVDNTSELFRAGAAGIAAIGLFADVGQSGGLSGIRDIVGEIRRNYYTEHHVQRD
jgi:thiamine-phosphate diphosphorylase